MLQEPKSSCHLISKCTHSNFTVNQLWFRKYENYGSLINQAVEKHSSLVYNQVHLFSVLYSFAVLQLRLVPVTKPLKEDVGTVDLTITASKPVEFPYNVTISTVAGTAEG